MYTSDQLNCCACGFNNPIFVSWKGPERVVDHPAESQWNSPGLSCPQPRQGTSNVGAACSSDTFPECEQIGGFSGNVWTNALPMNCETGLKRKLIG